MGLWEHAMTEAFQSNDLRTPWRQSVHTQIWNVTESARKRGTEHPQDDASLSVWFVHAPWMAPVGLWHWHYVGLVHLRDLPGQSKPPTRQFPEATHELIAMAVDPSVADPLSGDWDNLKFLSPMSVCQQFVAANDSEALRKIEDGLGVVVNGHMSLESEGRPSWRAFLLGESW